MQLILKVIIPSSHLLFYPLPQYSDFVYLNIEIKWCKSQSKNYNIEQKERSPVFIYEEIQKLWIYESN